MTIYEVHQGAAGESGTLPTLRAAAELAKAGDTIIVHGGVYREVLAVPAGTTWRAAEGEEVVVDGGYHPGLMKNGKMPPPTGYLPGREYGALVSLMAPGATVEGFTIRNAAGRGVTVSGDDCTVRGCRIDHCYGGGLIVTAPPGTLVENVVIEDNVITRLAMNIFDDSRGGLGEGVSGSMNLINARNCKVRRNTIAYGYGEGLNVGRGSSRNQVIGNTVHTCHHTCMYVNRSTDNEIAHNVLTHTLDRRFEGRPGAFPAALVIGDEMEPGRPMDDAHHAARNTIHHNLIVGLGAALIHVRNNNTANGYDTQLLDTHITDNTLIAGPETQAGILVQENMRGRAHRGSTVTRNVIDFSRAPATARIGTNNAPGVKFGGNAWSKQPPTAMRGEGDVYGELMLINPGAVVAGEYPDPATTLNIDNYRPRALSPLVGAGPNRATLGALAAKGAPPEEPPPPPPDDRIERALTLLTEAGQQLEALAAAGNLLVEHVEALREQVAVMAYAQAGAADDVAAARAILEG